MSIRATIDAVYQRWAANDIDGMLALLPDTAMFYIPGSTPVSGDHDKAGFRHVLKVVAAATARGSHRQSPICTYESATGVIALFDTQISPSEKYHSAHEWIFRDGTLVAFMLYIHEYELFARFWSQAAPG